MVARYYHVCMHASTSGGVHMPTMGDYKRDSTDTTSLVKCTECHGSVWEQSGVFD